MPVPAERRRRVGWLAALPAGVIGLHLAGVLAPAEPRLLGVPFGLALQLGIVALSTGALWLLARVLLPERESAEQEAGDGEPPEAGSGS